MKQTIIGLVAGVVICGFVASVQSQSTSGSSSQSGSGQVSGQASGSASGSGSASAGGSATGRAGGSTNSFGQGSGSGHGVSKPTHAIEWESQPASGDADIDLESLKRAQLDYLRRAADMGKVVWSGPYFDENNQPEGGGLTLVRFTSMKDAEQFASDMPMVKAGLLIADVHRWHIEVEAMSSAQKAAAVGARGGG